MLSTPRTSVRKAPAPGDELLDEVDPLLDDDEFVVELLLDDDDEFRRVRVNGDTGTIEWPNGADLDPVVLYATVTGRTIEDVRSSRTTR